VFGVHCEDAELASANISLAGEAKYWYIIANKDKRRFEELMQQFVFVRKKFLPFFKILS
jgi:hypothetical protein